MSFAKTTGIYEQIFARRDQRYTIAIPASYTDASPSPLILALHWGGIVTPFYGKSILMGLVEPALRELGAIIVAPDCQHEDWGNPASEKEITALLDHLQDNYNVDDRKILLTGYSKGGIGTWYLAARHQTKFAAAIPMAAPPQPDSASVDWTIPLYVIHSRADEHFGFEQTEQVVRQLESKGAAIEFVLLDDVSHYDAEGFVQPLKATIAWVKAAWAER